MSDIDYDSFTEAEPAEPMAKPRGRGNAAGGRTVKRSGTLDIGLDAEDRSAGSGRRRQTRGKAPAGKARKPKSRGFLGLFGRKPKPARGTARPAADFEEPARRGSDRRKKRRKRRGGVGGFIFHTIRLMFVVALVGVIGVAAVLGYFAAQLPSVTSWAVPERPPNLKILASDGSLIANRGDTGGEAVTLAQMPAHLTEAVIAIEDRRFYSHFGVDPMGLARAAITNLRAGDTVQGGSTLTQQLAKNLFLNPDRTMERKIQEVVLALWLEARYSKDQILEMYLNRVYLGAGAYGVDAAARRYFGKPVSEINLLEAATIAGLLKAPSRYAPTSNPVAAKERATVVLAAMQEAGYITEAERQQAIAGELVIPKQEAAGSGSYVADWVADLVPGFVGAVSGDLVVETTLEMPLQAAAAEAVRNGIDEHGKEFGVRQGALVSMTTDGAVVALVGGRDYAESQYNRAVSARRQPGSSFKPFVYLTALEYGLVPETIRIDEPTEINGWKPENYARDYRGPVTLQRALALSLNTVAAQLANEVGPMAVVDTAHRLGINSPLAANPSIALGTSEVSVLEMTGAFAPFANGGMSVMPYIITRIKSTEGDVLYERIPSGIGSVIDAPYVGMMNAMMRETLQAGTGRKAQVPGWDAGGKTGTSQDWRDAWFIGYTAHLVTGVWFGNDDNSPTQKASGGNLPATVWSQFMGPAHKGVEPAALPGGYHFRDAEHFTGQELPQQDIIGPDGRYDEYLDRYEPMAEPQFDDGFGDPQARGFDPNADPALAGMDPNGLPPEDPNYDPRTDPNYDRRYDPNYDPRYDPNYDPRFGGAPVAGPVPPADIGPRFAEPPPPEPPRERGFLGRLFGRD